MIKEFDYLIYPRVLWVATDDSLDECEERFQCRNDNELAIEPKKHWLGMTFQQAEEKETGKYGDLVIIGRELGASTLVHESIHVLTSVMADIGNDIYSYVNDNGAKCIQDEPSAYLGGFIGEKIYDVYKEAFKKKLQ